MAYFAMKYNDKLYANKELIREQLQVTNRQLEILVATGKMKATMILDELMYEADGMFLAYESIDLSNFELCMNPETHAFSDGEVFFLPGDETPFVKLSTVHLGSKYNRIKDLPSVKICGTIYVAMFRKIKGNENSIVIVDNRS